MSPSSAHKLYPILLSPLRVGAHTLRNRVIMGSMHTRLEHESEPDKRQRAFYGARAKGGAALIITGGFSPNEAGRLEPGGPTLMAGDDLAPHRTVVDEVHKHGAKILMQILHSGRYAKHDNIVGVSSIRSPINPRVPRPMTNEEIDATIDDFVKTAVLASQAGYDGVEIMGSEGYLINQFTAPRTNDRTDRWGGSVENRNRFSVEIVRRIRATLGPDFLVMYRISAIDLVERGSTADEIDQLALAVQAAGADIFNTGIGWHEAPVPTIAFSVPRAAFSFAVRRLRKVVSIPIVASNRINMPDVAENLLADGACDFVSMARPMLADPDFVLKAQEGRPEDINTCIACNQACLDFIFSDRTATCLVNPRACRETEFDEAPRQPKRIAVIGSGPAGLAVTSTAAARGHQVTLLEEHDKLGGQIHLARRVPGKTEFNEMLRYFIRQIERAKVDVRFGVRATADDFAPGAYDRIVIATGILPRKPDIEGIDHPSVVSYLDVLLGRVAVGKRVAIIGTGGIGYDVAEFLTHVDHGENAVDHFLNEYGIDTSITAPGGLKAAQPASSPRQVTLFQRRQSRPGERLGVSTGWILRNRLRGRGVTAIGGAVYEKIDDHGLHYVVDGDRKVFAADNIVICAGQLPNTALADELKRRGLEATCIGGAERAEELDALRAIQQGVRLAYDL
ncbi:MAG: NADPH-dependent 2,4-dienoyl-CoA reductase [Bradyrhizobium sp.]|uniref:oxidoreductase n=1 Tax=Bradyrhizobium sp. TaxID=376 RepID=UPI001D728120|nr:NADPH-dependent 2,4-dienoyl-CoA reductase [Bradyrhizobium sp.]MBV9559574.1 NADPH-dependent 2,4-dienoyl-CoA reductase [Bradyrhizobium sp.]